VYFEIKMDSKAISFLQINLQHSTKASTELVTRDDSYNIALIQEPYLYNGKPHFSSSLSKSTTFASDTSRACVRVDKSLPSWEVSQFTSRDLATVLLKQDYIDPLTQSHRQIQVYCASAYLDINIPIPQQTQLYALIDYCHSNQIPLLLGCDSNAHSSYWGCAEENSRGTDIEVLIDSYNLTLLNSGSEYTFVTSRASSIIDITLVNQWYHQHFTVKDWIVDPSLSFSDHKYISFQAGSFQPLLHSYRKIHTVD